MKNLRWILAPAAAIAVALAVACGGDSKDDEPGSSTGAASTNVRTAGGASTTSAAASTAGAPQAPTGMQQPDGDSLNVGYLAASLEAVESFRFDLSLNMDIDLPEDGSEESEFVAMFLALFSNIKAEGVFEAPNSVHATTTFFGEDIELIQIGSQSWSNDGSGWVENSGDTTFSMPFDFTSPSDMALEFIPAEELVGAETSKESVNGFETTRYSFDKDSLEGLAESTGEAAGMGDLGELDEMTLDIWLTEEGIPVKMKMLAEGQSEGSDMSIDFEFNLSDFNDPSISVERPI